MRVLGRKVRSIDDLSARHGAAAGPCSVCRDDHTGKVMAADKIASILNHTACADDHANAHLIGPANGVHIALRYRSMVACKQCTIHIKRNQAYPIHDALPPFPHVFSFKTDT